MRTPSAFLAIAVLVSAGCDAQAVPRRAHAAEDAEDAGKTPLRRVWSDARDYAKPSPDGSLITFVDWTTGDVAVHDLASGEARRVTDKGTWQANGSWAEEPRFSPDGRRIIYSYGNTQEGSPFVYELRTVALSDTAQQLVYRASVGEAVYPLDWHERAGVLAILDRTGGFSDLIVIDPATGGTRLVRTFQPDDDDPHRASFSSDARFIAYQSGSDIRIMDSEGAGDTDLEQGTLLGWTPDAAGVLFHGARAGTRAIWMIPLRDGQPTGATTLVRDGIPALTPGGFSRTGYFYSVRVDGPKVQLATVDVENARVLVQPVQITSPADGDGSAPAWSPDGTSYAYLLNTPGTRPRIMLRSTDGEHLRDVASLEINRVGSLLWEPNGRSVIVVGNGTAEWAAYRIDIASGEVDKLFEPAGATAALTPDGRTLVYLRSTGVFSRALAGGPERTLMTLPDGGVTDIAVSPDGRTVAHVRGRVGGDGPRRIVAYPIDGGAEREIARAPSGWHFESMAFTLNYTADGRHLLAVIGDSAQRHRLVAVPVDGGEPRALLELGQRREGPERAHARLHQDGRRLLFSTGVPRTEMWLLEHIPGSGR